MGSLFLEQSSKFKVESSRFKVEGSGIFKTPLIFKL